ncbi:8247_t:CDS:1 [Ambispora gerdemannii]|uniref:8247_t:CDS:1 n=1 Tax=Ambispora gerdemannii TaxID=144530 RepID=A0A9N9AY42_9GLOM|nr:8247_t:CDS:1 [Ambispora gerdemannii]
METDTTQIIKSSSKHTEMSIVGNTTISDLPIECFTRIFSFLVEDLSTVFSATLVNRTWCRAIMPLLWFDTLTYDHEKGYKIIETLIRCMNEEERKELIDSGVDYAASCPRPLFLYSAFIKEINWANLEYMVYCDTSYHDEFIPENSIWIKYFDVENMKEKIVAQLCKLIFRTANLEKLYIQIRYYDVAFLKFMTLPNVSIALANLKQVALHGRRFILENDEFDEYDKYTKDLMNVNDLVLGLKSYSHCITFLEVNFDIMIESAIRHLCDLIESQRHIEHAVFYNFNEKHFSIILALKSKWNTLVRLEFVHSEVSNWVITLFRNLGTFIKLEAVAFIDCEGYLGSIATVDCWETPRPKFLRQLYFDSSGINDILIPLIKISGITLEKLTVLKGCSDALFSCIAGYATNLLCLEINLDKLTIPSFLQAIMKLQNLQQLSMLQATNIESFSDEFWIGLSESNIDSLYFNCLLSPQGLTTLLSNQTNPIKRLGLGQAVLLTNQHFTSMLNFCQKRQIYFSLFLSSYVHLSRYDSSLVEQLKEWVKFVPLKKFDKYHCFKGSDRYDMKKE